MLPFVALLLVLITFCAPFACVMPHRVCGTKWLLILLHRENQSLSFPLAFLCTCRFNRRSTGKITPTNNKRIWTVGNRFALSKSNGWQSNQQAVPISMELIVLFPRRVLPCLVLCWHPPLYFVYFSLSIAGLLFRRNGLVQGDLKNAVYYWAKSIKKHLAAG